MKPAPLTNMVTTQTEITTQARAAHAATAGPVQEAVVHVAAAVGQVPG